MPISSECPQKEKHVSYELMPSSHYFLHGETRLRATIIQRIGVQSLLVIFLGPSLSFYSLIV